MEVVIALVIVFVCIILAVFAFNSKEYKEEKEKEREWKNTSWIERMQNDNTEKIKQKILLKKEKKADEINRGYRTSDNNRWQQLDFVVGIEIRLSNNPSKECTICKQLEGKYPKSFKWTGWHNGCKCHAISILKTQEEMMKDNERIMKGEKPNNESVNTVKYLPESIIGYVKKHPECKSEEWYINNKKLF